MINKFTQKAQSALSAALNIAEELGHSYIGTEHLLLGLLSEKDSIAARILTLRGADSIKIKKSVTDYIGIGSKSDVTSSDMTPRLHFLIEGAAREAEKSGLKYVGTEHLLAALITRRDCVALRLMEAEGICIADIKADLTAYLGSAPYKHREGPSSADDTQKKNKKSSLLSYGKDLTESARAGLTDPVLCRERETDRLIRILCRRSKNNPCLIGEPGVGKTAVVEGLAERIVTGRVPGELLDKRIITLDISAMIAGAKFRGEFEDRIKNVIDEVRNDPSIILFVDEMHIMVGAGAAEGAIDASNILKPSLSRGEIRMIGATTPAEYRAHIEKDSALERRFQPVLLDEPSEAETIVILSGLKDRYEKHHGILISDEAIRAAVKMSVRYIHDRFLPDKAIDLIDEAASRLKLSISALDTGRRLPLLESLEHSKEEAVKRRDFSEAAKIGAEERCLQRSSAVALLSPIENPKRSLMPEDIAEIISEQTGIPCQDITCPEDKRLRDLENILASRIIGQESAIRSVASAIRRSKSGLGSPDRPIGSFMFLGSSGVGKTELCRAIADTLFEKSDSLIRLDMSEYMEKHSVSKLIGAPPGYVGYGEGGILTERVRRHPYSVVLFDELEKAHPDIFHILLQILEDGRLTDSAGRVTDFSSTIIIMTSNLISSDTAKERPMGFSSVSPACEYDDIREHRSLREYFKPELLGRIDEIILFSSLNENDLIRITSNMLDDLCRHAEEAGLTLNIDRDVAQLLAGRCAYRHKDMGARPLRREIQRMIEAPLAEKLLSDPAMRNDVIRISVFNDSVTLSVEGSDLLN